MSSHRALISMTLFLAFVNLIAAGIITTSGTSQIYANQSSVDNSTLFQTSDGQAIQYSLPVNFCVSSSNNGFINALFGLLNAIPLVNCVAGFYIWTLGFQGITSGYVFLGIIDSVFAVIYIYIGIRLIRGGG